MHLRQATVDIGRQLEKEYARIGREENRLAKSPQFKTINVGKMLRLEKKLAASFIRDINT